MTEFKDIATVSGRPGLFKVVKPGRSGVILESMDGKKTKIVAGGNQRVSILSEISIYTLDAEGATPLEEVLKAIEKEFDGDTGLGKDVEDEEYKAFLKHVLPDYDEDRVYTSDIKKLVTWYGIIRQHEPELLRDTPDQPKEEEEKGAE